MDSGKSSIRIDRTTRGAFLRRLLYDLVDDPWTDSIVSWSESGKSFIVWNDEEFGKEFLPSRGLVERLSGFTKVESGQCEFSCDVFVKGQPPEITRPGITIPPAIHGAIASQLVGVQQGSDLGSQSLSIISSIFISQRKRLEMDSSSSQKDSSHLSPQRGVRILRVRWERLIEIPQSQSLVSSVQKPQLSAESCMRWWMILQRIQLFRGARAARVSSSGMKMSSADMSFRDAYHSRIWPSSHAGSKAGARLEFAEDYFLRGQPELTRPLTCEGLRILPETRRVYEKMMAYWKAARNQEAEKVSVNV